MNNFTFTRCAACGSDKVRIDSKKEGYNVGKGIVGTAVFGTAGAVMGLDGKKQTYYHCPECGQVLSYSMNATIVHQINELMFDTVKNKRALEYWKKQYPNITWEEPKENKKYSADDLADMIWNYYLKHQIPCVKESDIEKALEKELSEKVFLSKPIRILEEKGVVIYEERGGTWYLNFFTNIEDIQYNISKHNYYSNNSFFKFQNFEDKSLMVNIFQKKYAKQEFTLTEFKEKICEYILEQEYNLKNGVNDEICDSFFKSLKATSRIELNENDEKIFVHTLEEAGDLFDISCKQKEKERNNKIDDYIPKIMDIMKKEKATTVKIALKKYPDLFLEKEKYIVKEAFEKLVAEEKIYVFENRYSDIYSITETLDEEENETDFKKKFRAMEWMLEEKNKKQAEEWDLVEIITENEPISIGEIREKVGIERAIGEESYSLSQALDYYIYVEKAIEKLVQDKKSYYITYGSSDRIIEKQKLLEKEQELENKYADVVNNYKNCSNLLKLNEYITILESLEDYKDSSEIIGEINNKIGEIKDQQEKIQKQKELNKKKNKKMCLIAVFALVIVFVLYIAQSVARTTYENYKAKKQEAMEEQEEKIRIEESKIKSRLKSSITEVSKSEIDALQDTSENEAYKQNWKKYIDYCGVFEYVSETGNNTYKILSDFKLDNRFSGEAVWIVKNSDGSDISKDTPNPFRIKVNGNYIHFFYDQRNAVNSKTNKVTDHEGKQGYIEATIEFKDNTIIYSTGYYEKTDNYGKKENYNESFKYIFKKVE